MKWLRRAYESYDEAVQKTYKKADEAGWARACAGPGCKWCCYESATATQIEVVGVVDAYGRLDEKIRQRVDDQLGKWAEVHKNIGKGWIFEDEEDARRQFEMPSRNEKDPGRSHFDDLIKEVARVNFQFDTPCCFLIDGKCAIYEWRPAACRSHNMLTRDPNKTTDRVYTPEDCRWGPPLWKNTKTPNIQMWDLLAQFEVFMEQSGMGYPRGDLMAMLVEFVSNKSTRELPNAKKMWEGQT